MRTDNQTLESLAANLNANPRTVVLDDVGARRPVSKTVDAPVPASLAYEVTHAHPLPKRALPSAEEVAIERLVRDEDQVFNHKTGQWEWRSR